MRSPGGESRRSPVPIPLERAVTLDEPEMTSRYRTALRRAVAPDGAAAADAVVWVDAGAELLVRPEQATIACLDGLLLVAIPVFTEQTSEAELVVPFAVGGAHAPAGMLMATETRPRGPAIVVDRWAEPVTAAAWEALVALAVDAAAPASPRALSAATGALTVVRERA